MNLYAYCLSDDERIGAVTWASGVEGLPPRVSRFGEITAVVGDFEGERVAVTRENVRAHGETIGRVLAETTPLPFRFGTVASAERLASYIESQRASLLASFERVRGCVEMSVKIIRDVESARHGVVEIEPEGDTPEAAPGETATATGRGTAFLAAKRRAISGGERLRAEAEEIAAWLDARVGEAARETSVSVHPSAGMVVKASYLVERARLDEYRERLRAARAERADLRFLTSGAWPPYSFSRLRT